MPCVALIDYCDAGTLWCVCGRPSCLLHGHLPDADDPDDCPESRLAPAVRVDDVDLGRWRGEGRDHGLERPHRAGSA
jgi:hypothetical protein